jgi:hypothetical protein
MKDNIGMENSLCQSQISAPYIKIVIENALVLGAVMFGFTA